MIVLGFDPGGVVTGWALLEVPDAGARGLPRWRDGGATRQAATCMPELALLCVPVRCPVLVAVESVRAVYPRARFAAHMATCIAHASRVAGEIAGAARARGLEVVDVSAEEWRRALCSSARAADALIARIIPARIEGFPRRSNAHVRDAAGVALYAGLRALRVRATGTTKARR